MKVVKKIEIDNKKHLENLVKNKLDISEKKQDNQTFMKDQKQ